MKNKVKNKNRGITLIALVITIIVLLILAGITISTLTGENGLLSRAKLAGEKTKYVTAKEIVTLKIAEAMSDAVAKGETCEISNVAEIVAESLDSTLEKYYSQSKIASTNDVMPDTSSSNIVGIVVSANEYAQYKFLIGESLEIEKVLVQESFFKR